MKETKNIRKYVVLVSLDAISDTDVDRLLEMPVFQGLASQGCLTRGVTSVSVSNTYPNHVSAVTGKQPREHGVWSNLHFHPSGREEWNCLARNIKTPTIFSMLKDIGKKSCTILWPVTGGDGNITYNMPEMHVRRALNQIPQNLKYGSKRYQLKMLLRYFLTHLRFRIQTLDSFAVKCACRTIFRYRPDLLCLHLIAADTVKHFHGPQSPQAQAEIAAMDKKLGRIVAALDKAGIRDQTTIIVMGDHGCLPVSRTVDLNEYLRKRGVLVNTKNWSASFHLMGGTAALMLRDIDNPEHVAREREFVDTLLRDPDSGVGSIMPSEQFAQAGFPANALLCVEAARGVDFATRPHLGNHGYCVDSHPDYSTFYMVCKPGMQPSVRYGGETRDVFDLLCGEFFA